MMGSTDVAWEGFLVRHHDGFVACSGSPCRTAAQNCKRQRDPGERLHPNGGKGASKGSADVVWDGW